ncbi:MAG: hypothetical protein ACLP3C_06400 [Mycobacterium sp.]|uniref:hypothetical protein n=1 Tax=Mycobacterium sp. TaxID=1785 RepID=UPI003C69FCC0
MPVTERQEHELTQKALDKLTEWGKNPNSYGGENIAFALVRQGPLYIFVRFEFWRGNVEWRFPLLSASHIGFYSRVHRGILG